MKMFTPEGEMVNVDKDQVDLMLKSGLSKTKPVPEEKEVDEIPETPEVPENSETPETSDNQEVIVGSKSKRLQKLTK